jgi:hypothetical protein
MPAPGASTVACLADATMPTPPAVLDNCGRTLTVSAGVPGADPACAGTKTYTFTYTLCDNTTQTWVYTYTIDPPTPVIASCPAALITCETAAGTYTIPALTATDNCGKPLTITYDITGATNRDGTGDASGAFGVGTSTIVWTVSNGCTTTTCSTVVTINPLPDPEIDGPSPVCEGQTDTYSTPDIAGHTYEWTVVGGNITEGQGTHQIKVTWTSSGTGSVTVKETITATGCSETDTKTFTISPKPITTPITHN